MAFLIDSSIFVELERRDLELGALATRLPDEPILLASVTATELLGGVYRADSQPRRLRREAFVEAILSSEPVVPFDLRAARVQAHLSAQLLTSGQSIGAHDLQIPAVAIANDHAVLTRDLRHFGLAPGLAVRQLEP
jgi:predicted nucleic acid-binding protein